MDRKKLVLALIASCLLAMRTDGMINVFLKLLKTLVFRGEASFVFTKLSLYAFMLRAFPLTKLLHSGVVSTIDLVNFLNCFQYRNHFLDPFLICG